MSESTWAPTAFLSTATPFPITVVKSSNQEGKVNISLRSANKKFFFPIGMDDVEEVVRCLQEIKEK